jgi:hypothetical protein
MFTTAIVRTFPSPEILVATQIIHHTDKTIAIDDRIDRAKKAVAIDQAEDLAIHKRRLRPWIQIAETDQGRESARIIVPGNDDMMIASPGREPKNFIRLRHMKISGKRTSVSKKKSGLRLPAFI